MKRIAPHFFLFLAAAIPAAAGLSDLDNPGPAVTSVAARQRYPWNGLVDVDVSFEGKSGETYRIELSATDETGGTNLPVRTAWLEGSESAVGNPVDVPAPGTHRLVWNAGADLPAGFVADRVTVSAKLLNPIWSFANIPEIDPNDVWAPETVYHDVQTVAAYGEIEDHEPTVRCLTDEWNLEASLGANVVFSGASMGLRQADDAMRRRGVSLPIALWTHSDSTNAYRMVTLDYETGTIGYNVVFALQIPGPDLRFFSIRDGGVRAFADLCRVGAGNAFLKSAVTDAQAVTLACRYLDSQHGSAACGYFPYGVPVSDSSSTYVSSNDKGTHAALFFSGIAGTDKKEAVVYSPAGVRETSKYSCMGNAVGRYIVPLLDGNTFFTVACQDGFEFVPQHFRYAVGRFDNHGDWSFLSLKDSKGWVVDIARSKAVAMPDGERIFFGGVGRSSNGRLRMWCSSTNQAAWKNFPSGHPLESWARRDVTCLLPNGKFCGVDEELGLVVVNPLTGETYVASDDPVFKKGKMGCQLLPNGKVWIVPYDCEGREYLAGTNLCGKLYEVDFGFTRSFSLSSLCSPYLKVAEGDPEPSGIKVGLYPSGGILPGVYAQYYKGANPAYGDLPVPIRTGHSFLGWSTDATAGTLVSPTDPVPASGIQLKAAWTPNTYTVKFNANGGSGTMPDQTFTYGVAQALMTNAFTHTGYTFSGWATSASGPKVYSDKQSVSNLTATPGATVDLYAKWTANHGPGIQLWAGGPYWAETNIGAENPWDYGYYFWWGDTVGYKREGSAWVASDGSSSNFLFIASNAGTHGKYDDALQSQGWITADGVLAPEHDAAQVQWGDDWRMPTKSELSALNNNCDWVWTTSNGVKGYVVRGRGDFANARIFLPAAGFAYESDQTLAGYYGYFWSSNPSSVNNDYFAWYLFLYSDDHGTAGNWYGRYRGHSVRPVRPFSVDYTIKFNANGGSGTMSDQCFTYGVAQALTANAFARTGYAFAGWATNATGAKVFDDRQSVSNLTATAGGTVNLYAKWTANSYSVKFNKNATDATGSMSNESFTYGTAKALTANSFARTGYTFTGWATSATGSKVYDNQQLVSNLTATAGGTVNLYAVWTETHPLYMVIDLSSGSTSSNYPISYLSDVPEGGWTDENKTTKLVLRRIEPGTFMMGSPASEYGRVNYEGRHSVTLTKTFYIGVFELTKHQWNLVMGNQTSWSGNKTPASKVSYDAIRGSSDGIKWPTSNAVDATSFLGKLRSRTIGFQWDLPTEAQWEYACRAGTTTALNSGENLTEADYREDYRRFSKVGSCAISEGWAWGDGVLKTVGSYLPNAWGLYDMHGNIAEWCVDWVTSGDLSGPVTDPVGVMAVVINGYGWTTTDGSTSSGNRTTHPVRGGSYGHLPQYGRSAYRTSNNSSYLDDRFGFRICLTVE